MKPVEPMELLMESLSLAGKRNDPELIAAAIIKLNELIQAHNELLAKYESHTHGAQELLYETDPPNNAEGAKS